MKQYQLPKHIFLFGHRKQHGKDTCCDIFEQYLKERNTSYIRTLFAKSLKEQCAVKYDLDMALMESDEYKKSYPEQLDGKSVRDVLIEYGLAERAKDSLVFCKAAYSEMFTSGAEVAIVSDFRFPNEGNSCDGIYGWSILNNIICNPTRIPTVHRILVHRPDGQFNADGADDQVPDLDESYWNHAIINDDNTDNWKEHLKTQLIKYVEPFLE